MVRGRPAIVLTAALLAVVSLTPSIATAQNTPARNWEPRGFDFSPDGVWRVKARNIAAARAAALARGDLAALNAPLAGLAAFRAPGAAPFASSMMVSGILRVPVFLVRYTNSPDTTVLRTRNDYFDALLAAAPTQGRPYTIRTFYEEMSNGALSVQGQILGWVNLGSGDTFYEGNQNGLDQSGRVAQLISEAVAATDPSVDFGQFDNDGADGVPNSGDDDGTVDVAVFVHPERDGACGPPSSNRNLWSHRFFYSGWTGTALNTVDSSFGPGQTFRGFIKINSYTIQAGVGGTTACDAAAIMAPGTAAHETGHGLGLPDFYDTNPNDEDNSEGIGHWGLMGSGNYATPPSPSHMEGFSRLTLGWVAVKDATTSGTYRLGAYTVEDTIIRITPTVTNPRGEYYLIENRQAQLGDTALIRTKGPGLLIWHVDPQRYSQALSSNQVNSGSIHGLKLEQADGMDALGASTSPPRNRGDGGDPYPGTSGNASFTPSSIPTPALNGSGAFPGFAIDSIRQVVTDGEMRFRLRFGGVTIVRASDTTALIRFRGAAVAAYRDLFSTGDTATVSVDSVQTDASGRTRYLFASWSDAGARTHLATFTSAGATLTATVNRSHQAQWSATGTGTVAASPSIASGSFIAEGDSVTLTATPGAGQGFGGWTGDTITSNAVLKLRMNRPFTVAGVFQGLLTVVDTVLRAPVMGASYLDTLRVSGGTGTYTFSLQAGSGPLPPGLVLSPAGIISGTATRDSTWNFVVHVSSGSSIADLPLRLSVTAPTLALTSVVNQLLGATSALSAAEIRYLDLLGNNNTLFDVGDFVAWLDRTGNAVSAETMGRILARSAR